MRVRELGQRRNGVMDLRLGVWFSSLSLGGDFSSNDELSNIISLGEVEELSDLGRSL